MKRETDGLKRDIRMLNKENERLVKQIETTRAGSQGANLRHQGAAGGGAASMDVDKRLKKRELECQALWETLRDMYNSSIDAYDTRQLLDVLARRALDTKAKKKLNLRWSNAAPDALWTNIHVMSQLMWVGSQDLLTIENAKKNI